MKKEVIKVLIADDHDLIRQGLKRILSLEEDFAVVGDAKNGEIALEMLNNCQCDVAVLDLNMPLLNGIEVLKKVRMQGSNIKIIILTVESDRKTIHKAIEIGADGYLLKDSAGEEIVNAIKTVYFGEKYIDRSLISALFTDIKSIDKKTASIFDHLTMREVEVLMKISKGLSNKEIGEQLFLSEKTIKNYATNLFRKIDVEDRVHATIVAIQNNIDDYYKASSKNK